MKKWMSLILSIAMLFVGCSAFAETEEKPEAALVGTQLGFDVLKELGDGSENCIISPVSLAYALAMAAQGAEGETKQEILDVLGVEDLSVLTGLTDALTAAGLKLANAAFIAGEMVPNEEYVNALKAQFGAEWFEKSESIVDDINAWVAEHTDGLIEKLLEGELSEDIALVLVNAIAMDAKWAAPFTPDATFEDVFHAPDGDVTVPFMHRKLRAEYAERDGVQLLRLGYADSDLTLLIALPGEDVGMDGVLAGLSEEGLGYFALGEEMVEVQLSMPKLDIEAGCSLKDALQALGVKAAFGEEADFSGIADEPLKIGSVLQKARLLFDEDGTKAAAATAIGVTTMALLPEAEPVEFNMNRPFVAVIADEASGAVAFAGIVANPAGN